MFKIITPMGMIISVQHAFSERSRGMTVKSQ